MKKAQSATPKNHLSEELSQVLEGESTRLDELARRGFLQRGLPAEAPMAPPLPLRKPADAVALLLAERRVGCPIPRLP